MTLKINHAQLNAALGAGAFVDEQEIPLFGKYAANAQRIVEIGAAWGASAVLFLTAMPEGAHLSSVDPFFVDPQGGWQSSQAQCIQSVYRALATFGRMDRFKDWSLIPHTSEYVATRWEAPTPIDLLYIDGDHSELGVNDDWELWTPFVRQGGVVMLHDSRRLPGYPDDSMFVQGYIGPTKLADRLRGDVNWKLVDEAFSMTVWEKRCA